MSKIPWIVIDVSFGGSRLDVWLAKQIDGLSRRGAQRIIDNGLVTVDGRVALKRHRVEAGQKIAVTEKPDMKDWPVCPDGSMELQIVYHDEGFVAVNKPPFISSVSLSSTETGTLASAVVARFPDCATIGRRSGDGGLVQRLDRETSGVVLVALDQKMHDLLVEKQSRGQIEKRYLALVDAQVNLPSVIDKSLSSAGVGQKKMKPGSAGHKAVTKFRTISIHGRWALVEATIYHGCRHQIRAHLASVGAPIAGDELYGGQVIEGLERLFLHGASIRLTHPVSGADLTIDCKLPDHLKKLVS